MKELSPLELAFLGDAIHTLFVREYVLSHYDKPMNEIHRICSHFCSATHQSEVLSKLTLADGEAEIVRRARNAKAKHTAKNAEVKDYKFATAFEALIAYLKLNGKEERLQEILLFSVQ